MSSASKKVALEFNEKELANMLLKIMPDFHNKEPLSQYIAGALMELGDTAHIGGIIKLILGVNEELSYVKDMSMYLSYYSGISTWDIDKEQSEEKANAVIFDGSRNLYLSCKILEVMPHKLKSYYVRYEFMNTAGELKTAEAWVAEKDLQPQIKI